jgi:hypothetical protein
LSAPEYIAEEMLRLEGFSEVEYVEMDTVDPHEMLLVNRADISVVSPPNLIPALDAGSQSSRSPAYTGAAMSYSVTSACALSGT